MKNKNVSYLTQAAMIAAIYVVLTIVFAPISFGEIQVRIAEMLTILPIFTPAAIPGLFVGCLIGNITGGAILPDIICGSIATLIGAAGTYGSFTAYFGKCLGCSVCTSLCLRCGTSNSIFGFNRRNWGNYFLWNTGKCFGGSFEKIQRKNFRITKSIR